MFAAASARAAIQKELISAELTQNYKIITLDRAEQMTTAKIQRELKINKLTLSFLPTYVVRTYNTTRRAIFAQTMHKKIADHILR